MRCSQSRTKTMIFTLAFAVFAAAVVANQPDAITSTAEPSLTPIPPGGFNCQPFPTLSGEGSQVWRSECYGGVIPAGRSAEGVFNWTVGMTPDTTIVSVRLELVDVPGNNAEGTDTMFIFGSFLGGRTGRVNVPACASRLSFPLGDGRTQFTTLNWLRPGVATCPLAQAKLVPQILGQIVGGASAAAPTGLRIRLTCGSASAGGSCSAFVRLRVQFRKNIRGRSINVLENALRKIETNDEWRVEIRSWVDTEGVCGVKGGLVETEMCYPPDPNGGRALADRSSDTSSAAGGARKLKQQTLQMAAVYPYTSEIIVKATRLARYAAAIHGCQPTLNYTAADGTIRRREWDGPTGMRNWGGPGINRQPGPECRSCFKDGISFSEDPPRGFQTPVFNLDNSRTTFNDAALTFLDRTITGVDGRNAIVVLFRATVSDIQSEQWLSNLGACWALERQVPVVENLSYGSVCEGWNTPVNDLNALGLVDDVVARLNRLPAADRAIYVTGHSRGGALAAVFAAKLIYLQANGLLPAYSGNPKDQIKLYTYGAPRVGNSQFAANLEASMLERYRIVNRYDGVPTKPVTGYAHFRPTIWYRDSSGSRTASPSKGCVLLNQNQLTSLQTSCFISCNSALTCSYGAGADNFNQTGGGFFSAFDNVDECMDITDSASLALSATTLAVSSVTLIDHASYLGLDMNNDGCRADLSFINSIRVERGLFINTCIPVKA